MGLPCTHSCEQMKDVKKTVRFGHAKVSAHLAGRVCERTSLEKGPDGYGCDSQSWCRPHPESGKR